MMEHIEAGLAEAANLVNWFRTNQQVLATVQQMAEAIVGCLRSGGRVLTCGNGGSMCDAMHFAEELSGRYRKDRPALAAMAISDPSHLTCVANDFGFDQVFARGVEAWGRAGDVLIGFSTSGNSPNVVRAVEKARSLPMKVLGLLGRDGGQLRPLCDLAIVVPAQTSDRIQEIHIKVVHLVIELVERQMFPQNYV
ncbi:MAG: D-sedoheptulose 7-phosphate isomerase [Planctomycetes bacterium]|nr:D-sedoheptulose 7-phosphate isomerase [Planctomycetota bacterium]